MKLWAAPHEVIEKCILLSIEPNFSSINQKELAAYGSSFKGNLINRYK